MLSAPQGDALPTPLTASRPAPPDRVIRRVTWQLAGVVALACVLFLKPLINLVTFAVHSEFYSYVLLIPAVSAYLLWERRADWAHVSTRPLVLPLVLAATALVSALVGWSGDAARSATDFLFWMILSWTCVVIAGSVLVLGRSAARLCAFPLAFLFLTVPPPDRIYAAAEQFLQNWSADVAYWFFEAGMVPVWRQDTVMHLPGTSLRVAPECCGIHSTVVLFITSLLASYLFLRRIRHRAILIALVLPIALLRNGFRIFVIGELCVRIGPEMIDSYIHRHGGPIFFVLSLIPLLGAVRLLRRWEQPCAPAAAA